MPTHVLDQDAPGLASRLTALKPENQRKVLVKAALFAAESITKLDAKTQTALDDMRFRGELSPQEAIFAMHLSEAADERYLTLQEQGAPADVWGNWFSQARLLRGIAVGFGAAPKEDIADAIYEIAKSIDNPAGLFQHIASEMRTLPANHK
jgi:hypothetical protein